MFQLGESSAVCGLYPAAPPHRATVCGAYAVRESRTGEYSAATDYCSTTHAYRHTDTALWTSTCESRLPACAHNVPGEHKRQDLK